MRTKMKTISKDEIKIKESNVIEEWASQYPEVVGWLKKLQAKEFSALNLYYYCYAVEKTPTELLALENKEAGRLLNKFIAEDVGLKEANTFNVSIAVRSFYKHNLYDLPKAAGMTRYQKVNEHPKPKKDDLRKLHRFCTNPRDRSMLTLLCSSAIAKESLANLKWEHFEDNWQEQDVPHISLPPELIKGHGIGKYAGVRQETFLTPEAKRDLIEYKAWMEKKRGKEFRNEENVYRVLNRPFKPLDYKGIGRIFTDLQKNSGVNFSPHDARRWVETNLEDAGTPLNWIKKIKGRKLGGEEAPYSQPAIEQLREKFREAVPLLEFTSEKPIVSESDRRIITAIDNLRMSGVVPEERLKEMEREYLGKTPETAIPEIGLEGQAWERVTEREGKTMEEAFVMPKEVIEKEMEEIRKERIQPKTATNGGQVDCQRIVSEQELEAYLNDGWHVAAVLPSGKIVVETV